MKNMGWIEAIIAMLFLNSIDNDIKRAKKDAIDEAVERINKQKKEEIPTSFHSIPFKYKKD